jgi:hypothetical protein
MEGKIMEEILIKNLVLIDYLKGIYTDFKVKAEFSTNNDEKVIVVQEQPGNQIVFFGDIEPLFNYYEIVIYGLSIQEMKNTATSISALKGKHVIHEYGKDKEKWQIIFKQYSNPQAIEYMDIRRVGYSMIFQCIVNRVA